MKNSSVNMDAPTKRHGRGRRRLAYVIGFLVMIPLGFFVNAGPYQDYQQVREQLRAEEEEVALLESENATYVGEIERLQKDSYVEALARRELTYSRPGEDVFIVKNLPDSRVETAERSAEDTGGPLESMVRSLEGLF